MSDGNGKEVIEAEVVKETTAIQPVLTTPAELLRIAVSQGADLEKLEKLMDLQERWEKNEAKKAFVAAMAAFKSERTEIIKTKKASFDGRSSGHVEYTYAPLNEVCEPVIDAMSKHGISHRWKIEQQSAQSIRVTCILTHEMGHSEETTMEAGPDNTGSKNAIQAIASTVSYLERYTLLAATGLAAADQDNDANTPTTVVQPGPAAKVSSNVTPIPPKAAAAEPSAEKPAAAAPPPAQSATPKQPPPDVFNQPVPAYKPLGDAATIPDRIRALEAWAYPGNPRLTNARADQAVKYAFFLADKPLAAKLEKRAGLLDMEFWNAAARALAPEERRRRIGLLESMANEGFAPKSFKDWVQSEAARIWGEVKA